MTNVSQIALSKLSDKLQILIIRCQTQSCSLRKKFNIGLLFRQVALKMVTKLSNVRHKSSNGTDLTHSSWIPIYFIFLRKGANIDPPFIWYLSKMDKNNLALRISSQHNPYPTNTYERVQSVRLILLQDVVRVR